MKDRRKNRWRRLRLFRFAALPLVLFLLSSCAPSREDPVNVIFISMDTARKDRCGLYGYDLDTTPFLDRLASECAVFENTFCQSVNTGPSHASIFTGLYPHTHGCLFNSYPLPEENLTLAEMLDQRGYMTAAFVSGYTLKDRVCRMAQGFQTYDDHFTARERPGEEVTQRAIRWLDEGRTKIPFFLFLHYFDIHGPYNPPEPLDRQFIRPGRPRHLPERAIPRYQRLTGPEGRLITSLEFYMGRYDGEVRYVNGQIERFFDYLRTADLLEKSVIVIFSDHGESLDERFHALDHGSRLTDEQIAIPLLVRFPRKQYAGKHDGSLIESIDIMPTVLDYLDVRIPGALEGSSLLPLISGKKTPKRRFCFSEAKSKAYRYADKPYRLLSDRIITSIRDDRWKLIELPGEDHPYYELYDLLTDPGEQVNLADKRPAQLEALKKRLLDFQSKSRYPGAVFKPVVDRETWRQLKSLGYVE
jgi:arylsulfatase A-like enzyme